jgi:predicted nuclease with TOPRIM domain
MIDGKETREQVADSLNKNGLTEAELRLTHDARDFDVWGQKLTAALTERGVSGEEIAEKLRSARNEKLAMAAKELEEYDRKREERGLREVDPDPFVLDLKRLQAERAGVLQEIERASKDQKIQAERLLAELEQKALQTQLEEQKKALDDKIQRLANTAQEFVSLDIKMKGLLSGLKSLFGGASARADEARYKELKEIRQSIEREKQSIKKSLEKTNASVREHAERMQSSQAPQKEYAPEQVRSLEDQAADLKKQIDQLEAKMQSDGYAPLVAHAEFYVSTPEYQDRLAHERADRYQNAVYESDSVNLNDREAVVSKVRSLVVYED